MEAGITHEFETTDFAGITARIINPGSCPFTVLDMSVKPGFGAPRHISFSEDKLFIVIEGVFKYVIDEETGLAGPGDRVTVPKGMVHGFTNVSDGVARQILVSTPRRHEDFFRDMHNIPEPREANRDRLPAITQRHDQAIVGALP
ncbi:cupin domain-containing protein [Paraburkholderia solisilvae]|uniref:Cupin type-2 domain-containing protein n=1 Tax=Paraburkholderia solisilvae TaxID=624376 RepID=A0A6J5E7N4_9BURK|nr:cupin domain-containing protein [Paraburkholderia solisilvae]CAB3761346.1 hypothetical protein LMG29739_03610 [Paraburkholderia solisilvae]